MSSENNNREMCVLADGNLIVLNKFPCEHSLEILTKIFFFITEKKKLNSLSKPDHWLLRHVLIENKHNRKIYILNKFSQFKTLGFQNDCELN